MAIFTVYQLNENNVSQVYVAARFGAWNGVADFLTVIFAYRKICHHCFRIFRNSAGIIIILYNSIEDG